MTDARAERAPAPQENVVTRKERLAANHDRIKL